ncbi:hypothetical protein IEQ34_001170 [Dendrobium chrysotoxum]|uniref:Uncharacterized protein n=1 Tax=Dendrobium chrysotoxum TaxID=161865 RepID=A0AAV7HMJ4_DENCH|nr:hypothetical protein IEQ34_001170 [Dendrobium chrysotoxum]
MIESEEQYKWRDGRPPFLRFLSLALFLIPQPACSVRLPSSIYKPSALSLSFSLSLLLFSSVHDAKKRTHEQSEMPAQKQAALSASSPSAGSDNSSPFESAAAADPPDENHNAATGEDVNTPSHSTPPQDQDGTDSDGEGGSSSTSSQSSDDQEEYILVKLVDIRKEVQCPICLGMQSMGFFLFVTI